MTFSQIIDLLIKRFDKWKWSRHLLLLVDPSGWWSFSVGLCSALRYLSDLRYPGYIVLVEALYCVVRSNLELECAKLPDDVIQHWRDMCCHFFLKKK